MKKALILALLASALFAQVDLEPVRSFFTHKISTIIFILKATCVTALKITFIRRVNLAR